MTTSSTDVSSQESEARSVPATSATTSDVPAFGWSGYAERVNGRFAMVGFAAVLVVEALSHDTFLHWAGLVP
ncbi:MAG: chlorophyll a/b-binding protein [Synechococcus sp.]